MEKLRRVLTGQDDEEQGLTAQVLSDEARFIFPFPALAAANCRRVASGGTVPLTAG